MLDRINEPELMLCPDQVKAYAEADFSASDSNVLKALERHVSIVKKNIDSNSVIIDIGCGPGNITELLAKRWPSSTVIGIDGSEEMLRAAKSKAKRLCCLKGIKYIKEDLVSLSKATFELEGSVDLLVSNSLLHHIHDASEFWLALIRIGSKGSVIFQRDLRRPSSEGQAIRLLKKYLPSAPSVLQRDYLASLYAAFTVEEVKAQLRKAGLYQLKVFEVDDRYLDVIGVL